MYLEVVPCVSIPLAGLAFTEGLAAVLEPAIGLQATKGLLPPR